MLTIFLALVVPLAIGILSVKYTSLAIDLLYSKLGGMATENDTRNWLLYSIVMVCLSPYLLLLEVYPVLKDKWILTHKNSINRVFLN